ncbi:hypothetical protein HHK36_007376 [Tetracentron sinense]|uniref:Probable 6-phosphogluconolactonase n=1 Tax=Tetracentron sinense TaxID=13715 RepID=A0A834ZRM0_TETSI|nr:hypothetical protein HHK36_007376 [Tetracentron sinense]
MLIPIFHLRHFQFSLQPPLFYLITFKLEPCETMAFSGNHNRGDLRIHDSLDELATDLADYIAELSEVSMKERGVFAIALSGGSLISLMGKLCEAPYNKTVDWAKWYVFWADQRVVAKNHADSNYKLAKDGLLSTACARGPQPCILYQLFSVTEEAANEYEFILRQLVKTRIVGVSEISDCPKFDLIVLEMGPDGHVASLFPNHTVLEKKDEWVSFITDSPKPPPERITLTLPVINSASNVAVVVTGCSKAEAVHLAIDDVGPDCPLLPVPMVQPTNGKLVWFLDIPATSKLEASQFSK